MGCTGSIQTDFDSKIAESTRTASTNSTSSFGSKQTALPLPVAGQFHRSTPATMTQQWCSDSFQQQQQQQHLHHHHHHRFEQQAPVAGCFGTRCETGAMSPSIGGVFQDNLSLSMLLDVAPLDQGGFCVVCSCTYMGRRAVLKVPKPQGPQSAVEDLLVEIDIYKRISARGGHPNIATAFGSGFHLVDGKLTPFLVLEMLQGGNLAKALERSRPRDSSGECEAWSDPVPRLPVALELADAMHFLHHEVIPCGFVLHRDLKPTNIGLCAEGHVKVFDLGLSVVQEVREGNINQKYQMSGMAGSKRFMSPEVCNGLPYNEKVDVYSFAIVLWELCALQKPFAGMSVADHYREVITGGVRPPLDPRWPTALQHLLQACWHEDPDLRPSILEAKEVLRRIFVGGGGWDC